MGGSGTRLLFLRLLLAGFPLVGNPFKCGECALVGTIFRLISDPLQASSIGKAAVKGFSPRGVLESWGPGH